MCDVSLFIERQNIIEAQREIKVSEKSYSGTIPATIPLNIIDRVFFVPESNDYHGEYFPGSFARVTRLYHPLSREDLVTALIKLDQRFPQMRIGYRINADKVILERVADNERDAYFDSIVRPLESDAPSEEVIADLISYNTEPLGTLLNVFYRGDELYIKMFHVLGDARYLASFTYFYYTALFQPEKFDQLPELDDNFWIPIWKVIWHTPKQAFNVLSRFSINTVQKVFRFITELIGTKEAIANQLERKPLTSHTPVGVVTTIVNEDNLKKLFEARKHIIPDQKVSLNNLLQVEIALRLKKKGYISQKVTYTIPVDLRRYMPGDTAFYPGNLASQIRVSIDKSDPVDICKRLQEGTEHQFNSYVPLLGMPFEWLTNLLPRKVYDGLHQSWSLNPHLNPERFFVISNVGSLDAVYGGFGDFIDLDMFGTLAPLDNPLVVIFSTLNGRGQITTSFDPKLISHEDVCELIDFNNQPLEILEQR